MTEKSDLETRWVIGMMSGTSMDGIDAALIQTDGERVFQMSSTISHPYEDEFRSDLRAILRTREETDETREIEQRLTRTHIDAVEALIRQTDISRSEISLIGFHGQTINHVPEENFTWQIGDAALLARETGLPVIYDFRSADVAAGGEGAPLAPVYHAALAADIPKPVVFLNVGGVSNVTFIDAKGQLLAFDTGPGNAFMDDLVLAETGEAYDYDGRIARQGRVDQGCLEALLDHDYFDRKPPKSLDRYDFTAKAVRALAFPDQIATLAEFTAVSIARALDHLPARPANWLVCGGGRHNSYLMERLRSHLPGQVKSVDEIGCDGDMIEAQAFAFMALRCLRKLPISFPGTTNAPRPMTGGRLQNP